MVRAQEGGSRPFISERLRPVIAAFLAEHRSTAARTAAMQQVLESPAGDFIRQETGKRIVEILSVLIPDKYAQWRALVQDAMLYTVLHLSAKRLAPKLVEQTELPPTARAERRLMRLIARVPGLQKLGQVVARNRHLAPSLRRALSELENGIADVAAREVQGIIRKTLGQRLRACKVTVARAIFSEASVSAVVRFTWWNPELQQREHGVFKVLKPHIPACYAEDMELLHGLAGFLTRRHGRYGVPARGVADTFTQVRRLLEHEVDFAGEQATLAQAQRLYGGLRGVCVPRLIGALCAPNITAMTEMRGVKITSATHRMSPKGRQRVAEQLVRTLISSPLLADEERAMFHADPHAGNLLYDRSTGELSLLDWALTDFLTREQRRRVTLLFVLMTLRDREGVAEQMQALSRTPIVPGSRQARLIRHCVDRVLDVATLRVPSVMDAMRLLERAAFAGIRLPAPLILLRKVMLTLDGILHDVAGPDARLESILAREVLRRWAVDWRTLGAPLSAHDWMRVEWSALFAGSRWGRDLMQGWWRATAA